MDKPTEPGTYLLTAAGYAGPYSDPSSARWSAQNGLGTVVRFRECDECTELHTGDFSNCAECQRNNRADATDEIEADEFETAETEEYEPC